MEYGVCSLPRVSGPANRKNKIITSFRYAFYTYLLYIYAYENIYNRLRNRIKLFIRVLVAWAMF